MEYDGLYALVTWTMLLIVLPIFLVIFAVACLFMAPILVTGWVLDWLRESSR